MFNSNRSTCFLLFLVVLLLNGCAQQQTISYAIPEATTPLAAAKNTLPVAPPALVITQPIAKIDIPAPLSKYSTVWERLFSLYALPEINNKRIDREIKRYLKHPEYLQTIQKRAKPYLYAIVEEIEAKHLPGELALLPVVESAFKPHAYSRSKAAGLWQFIPSTGRFFGLEQNWWYDGRRDIHSSTQVATNYLKELNETFDGDWMLALAAYNAGKGTVAKAIKSNKKKHKPTHYWSLPLSQETQHYVPRLLAIARIFANADAYNIPLHPIPNKPVYEIVDVGSQLDLAIAAKLANTPMHEFILLNPGFKRWSTAPNGPHRLLIPVGKVASFKYQLAHLAANKRVLFKYKTPNNQHKIRSGESLSSIAKRYGTTVQEIRQANMLKSNHIVAGHYLFVPKLDDEMVNSYLHGKSPRYPNNKQDLIYIVKKGDNLWGISRKFSVSTTDIIRWNKLANKSTLRPGQKLIIKNVPKTVTQLSPSSHIPFHLEHYLIKKNSTL